MALYYSGIRFWTLVILSVTQQVFSNTALLIIDVQNCFLLGGSLAVTNGDHVIPVINNIRRYYENQISLTVLSQDWNCSNHVSFASQHAGKQPLETITLEYDHNGKTILLVYYDKKHCSATGNGNLCSNTTTCHVEQSISQTLWPDHCVINSTGANFGSTLDHKADDVIVPKGYHCDIESYSASFDNGGFTKTELEDILRSHNITTVIVTGLALDFCVYYTSKDARKLGVHVINSTNLVNYLTSTSTSLALYFYYITLLLCIVLWFGI